MASSDEQQIIQAYNSYREEAKQARFDRMNQNRLNYDCYHLRGDFEDKNDGQSQEFLPKQAMAVEQAASQIQQALTDQNDWFKVEPQEGLDADVMNIKPDDIRKLLQRQLGKNNFNIMANDMTKSGLLGSLVILKIGGEFVTRSEYRVKEELKSGSFSKKLVRFDDKVWQLKIDLVRQEDYYPDPTGRGLYVIQDSFIDLHELKQLAEGPNAIYDKAAVAKIGSTTSKHVDGEFNKSRETGQNTTNKQFRRVVKVSELWGSIVDSEGNLIHENVVTTIANDQFVIRKPTPNPFWHGESPFVTFPLLRVPHSVWHKALMDSPSILNKALNEVFNLILDGGIMGVFGIKQARPHWLEDTTQLENGISAGDTLVANRECPPGQKVIERVDTASIPPEAITAFNLLQQEFNTAALSSDLRQGAQSIRAVKATEVIEQSNALSSIFNSIAKNMEGDFDTMTGITKVLDLAWKTIAQHMKDLNSDEVKAMLGENKAGRLQALSNQEIFAETVQGCRFNVFGISATLNKQRDFTKLGALLQNISGSEVLTQEFAGKFDFAKLLEEIMRSLDINPAKLKKDEEEQVAEGIPAQGPDQQSQQTQIGAQTNQGDLTAEGQVSDLEIPRGGPS